MRDWEREWFRMESPFPREAMLNRVLVESYEQFDAISRRNGYVDIYSSVFSTNQLIDDQLDTFLFDIDGTVRFAYKKMQTVLERMVVGLDYVPRIYCSGQGYHFYVDVKPMKARAWRELNRVIVDGLGIRALVDNALVGNPRMLARVPGTRNSKTGWWMVKIDASASFEDVKNASRKRNQDMNVDENRWVIGADEIISRLGAIAGPQTNAVPETATISTIMWKAHRTQKYKGFPPCIEAILREIDVSGECDHERRVFLASVLTRVEDIDTSVRRFEKAGDFIEHTTRYQLEHIKSKRYIPARCDTVQGWGICPGNCQYYPNIGRSLSD